MKQTTVKTLTFASLFILSACSSISTHKNRSNESKLNLDTLYDYQLVSSTLKESLDLGNLVISVKDTDVVFLGELHTHQASHKFQLDFLVALYRQNPKIVLSMEQFSRDSQAILSGYLEGKYGEETLIEDGDGWSDYKGSYRAIVEFAREKNIPIIAANAPAMFVRCVGKEGASFLERLPKEKSEWASKKLDLENEKYKAKFMSFIKEAGRSHGQTSDVATKRQMNTYAAQLLRDTTMAESIASALETYPDHQIVHLNGSFHSDGRLGTVGVLETTVPEVKASVVSPLMVDKIDIETISQEQFNQGEFLYLLKELPERYLDKDKEMAAITKLIRERMKKKCEIE